MGHLGSIAVLKLVDVDPQSLVEGLRSDEAGHHPDDGGSLVVGDGVEVGLDDLGIIRDLRHRVG